jgi:hypothetical protein
MTLLVEHEAGRDSINEAEAARDEQRELRHIRLEAQADGKTLNLVERDSRKAGVVRETRYEITPAELIASIRQLGREIPHEIAVPGAARTVKASSLMRPLDMQRAPAPTVGEPAAQSATGLQAGGLPEG